MKKNLEQFADQTILKARKRKVRRRILALLSVFVLFVTTNQLIFAADTLEHIAACGLAEHTHTEACYGPDGELDCGLKEHEHTDACYQERPKAEAKDAEEPVDAEDEDEETSEEPYELDE
ncbi:MAG: hypothetical protein IKG55_07575, partial [Solobacterium sp.]|nr:hypothetical protein [Solobacterium sp.]